MTIPATQQNNIAMTLGDVRRTQIDFVYDSRLYAVLSMGAIALLLYVFLAGRNDLPVLNYWLSAIVVADIIRLAFTWYFMRARKLHAVDYATAEVLLYVGTAISGIVWGSLGLLVLPYVDSVSMMVIVGALTGITAGSTTTLSYRYKLAVMFILLALLPMMIGIYTHDAADLLPFVFMLGIYVLFLMKNTRVFYNNTVEMLRLKTESRKREEELLLERKKVEQANQAKSSFLANMSHELRTPMHAILGFSDLGASKAGSATAEKTASYFSRIHDSGQRLLRLLDSLLDLSKLESGRMIFEYTQQDLQSTINAVIEEFDLSFREHALTVDVEPSGLDTLVVYDQKKISQVVRNLLSNAIRYTPDGMTIMIYFEDTQLPIRDSADAAATQAAISISIVDQGPGVPDDEHESVFDKFVQSSKTRTGAGGTGLGLSICKEIITHHGGEIRANNSQGGGAMFTFTIPRNGPLAQSS